MSKIRVLLATVALFVAGSTAYGLYSVADTGMWPKSWPQELEPLRKQSQTFVGPTMAFRHYAIPFTKQDDFEAAWPHLLKAKSQGAPIFLLSEPNFFLGEKPAGVIVHCPPEGQWDNPNTPEAPLENQTNPRMRWRYTNYIELVVDGKVVDLNRIPFPADTPIIDERFASQETRSETTESKGK